MSRRKSVPSREANDRWDEVCRSARPLLRAVMEFERKLAGGRRADFSRWTAKVLGCYDPLYHLTKLMGWPQPPAFVATTEEGIQDWRDQFDEWYVKINDLVYGPAGKPTIYRLGDRTYCVGQSECVFVNDTEDCLLQAFIGQPTLDLKALARRSGMAEAHVKITLGRLCSRRNGMDCSQRPSTAQARAARGKATGPP